MTIYMTPLKPCYLSAHQCIGEYTNFCCLVKIEEICYSLIMLCQLVTVASDSSPRSPQLHSLGENGTLLSSEHVTNNHYAL